MKQKITNAEKLYHLLFEICTNDENKRKYADEAYEVILSVTLIMKDNSYKDIREIVNPNDIKTFFILNQLSGKKIILLAKNVKSSSYKHGELRVNRYKTVINSNKNYEYRRDKHRCLISQKNKMFLL